MSLAGWPTEPDPYPLTNALRAGQPLWVLPLASTRIPDDANHWRFLPPGTPGTDWACIDDVPTAMNWRPVTVTTEALRWEVHIPEETLYRDGDAAVEKALVACQDYLSGELVRHRMVASGPAQIALFPPSPFHHRPAHTIRWMVKAVEAIPGVTVETLHDPRVSDSPMAGLTTVVEDPRLEEGIVDVDLWSRTIIVGARPLSQPHRVALETVRRGLADVLRWLGEPVETPMHHEVMHALRTGAGPGWPAVEHALRTGTSRRPDPRADRR